MSIKHKYLIYRGQVQSLQASGNKLVFATEHAERHPMGVYVVDVDTGKPHKYALDGGGKALAVDKDELFVSCTDKRVYRGALNSEAALVALGEAYEEVPTSLSFVANNRLAVGAGKVVAIIDRDSGKLVQSIALDERVTVMTADASGEWLVIGTERGLVMVYEREDKQDFAFSSQSKLHEGEVTVLLFEKDELRVLSSGSDHKLLVTHVRGELDPEDRGGTGMHDKRVSSMIQGPGDRFYTASHDGTIKSWPGGRNRNRPVTLKDNVVKTEALCVVSYNERPHVAAAGLDGTLRLFSLDDEHKLVEAVLVLHDAFAWARQEFGQQETERRERALKKLASFNDTKSLEMISERVGADADHKLKVLATELLGDAGKPKAAQLIRDHLFAQREDVRVAAFEGLRKLEGQDSLKPMEAALSARKRDIGELAVAALSEKSKQDEKALDLLVNALNTDPAEVRAKALGALEDHFGPGSCEAHLLALRSTQVDIRILALVRCFQLNLLDEDRVEASIRRLYEDGNENVRLNAFLISLLKRPSLAAALRSRDAVLHRQLFDVELIGQPKAEGEVREPPVLEPVALSTMSSQDYEPLLEAMSSRALDTCMRGAQGLATLQDTRSFGTLLQLSRESNDGARVQACQSFGSLGDPRSLKRLRMMLRDNAPAVRDAAFSALVRIEADVPLSAARAGLAGDHEDVRRRGLQVLVGYLRDPQSAAKAEAKKLLAQTLNDRFQPVRSEAFKAALSLKIDGGEESALRFATASLHADVRLDVLVEVEAQIKDEWAWKMLLEFFEDPESTLRQDAFEFSLKKAKKERRRESLAAALKCRYADIRLASVKELTERSLDDFADLIVTALDDDAENVRQTAVSALVVADARELLARAMASKHDDVRVRAAVACASQGLASALPVLLELATRPAPDKEKGDKGDVGKWMDQVVRALEGVAELGDQSAQEQVWPLIESKHAKIRKAAVRALVWCSRRESLARLREVVRHEDAEVKKEAALGLAYYGDSTGASMIFGGQGISTDEEILAALGLLEEAEDQFFAFLDRNDNRLRRRAFLLLLLLELSESDGIPDKCLAALSSEYSDVRLDAAKGLELFTDRAAFEAFVFDSFRNLHGGKQAWETDAAVIKKLSLAITHGSAQVRIRAARLVEHAHEESADQFNRAWSIYEKRYSAELDQLMVETRAPESLSQKVAKAWRFIREAVGSDAQPEFDQALRSLVFGAYVGLSRQRSEDRIRTGAIDRLTVMGLAHKHMREDARRVLVLALNDSSETVRQNAFNKLVELEMAATPLATEALSTPYADMGARGLQLLAQVAGGEEGRQLLQEQLLTKSDGLEEEAAKLLADQIGWTAVYRVALGAAAPALRRKAISNLVRVYDTEPEAVEALGHALKSRFDDVRFGVAEALAQKKDAKAFPVLEDMLSSTETSTQRRALDGFKRLGDARAAQLMLDRVDQDESGTADVGSLLTGAASFRDTAIGPRLLDYIDRNRSRWEAFQAALTISGFDQTIEDPQEEREDQSWLELQHPRHDALLAKLVDIAYRLADMKMLQALIEPHARWAKGSELDAVLAPLAGFSRETIQNQALEAISWRLRKRSGPSDALVKQLQVGGPVAQFLAAEGLALAGRKDGLSVLMTAVHVLDDYDHRRRAILALGKLGDMQALDLLLEQLQDESGTLRAPAAEAIGHMSKSDRAEEIFKTLVNLTKGGYDVAESAMIGLRWFNTPASWRVIRDRATDGGWWIRQRAARLLRHNPDQANIDMLVKLIREDSDSDVVTAAAESLRKIYDADSLEPDYILVQSSFNWLEAQKNTIERLRDRGDVKRILEILPKIKEQNNDKFLKPLVTALMSRSPLPVDEVVELLSSDETRTATVAAQIVGRAGKDAAAHADRVTAALAKAHTDWMTTYAQAQSRRPGARAKLGQISERYKLLVWTASRVEVSLEMIIKATELPTDRDARPVCEEALLVLSQPWVGDQGLDALERAAQGTDAALRTLAATSLRQVAPDRARALLSKSLEDAPTFNQLIIHDGQDESLLELLRGAAKAVHYQGLALNHMVKISDIEGLAEVMRDRGLEEELRMAAIEALARVPSEDVDDQLVEFGTDETEDEELRMGAWRALRRARRLRERNQSTTYAEVRQ